MAFLEARNNLLWDLEEKGDLTAFGDAASGKRSNLAQAGPAAEK